jgi:CBS domain-containing protein
MPHDHLLDTDVLTAAPDTTVADVARAFRESDDDVCAVLDEGRPLGLVTAADLGRAVRPGEELAARSVADLLADDPVTIQRSADRSALLSLFEAADARHVVVLEADGTFAGVATLDAVVGAYGRELTAVLELLD